MPRNTLLGTGQKFAQDTGHQLRHDEQGLLDYAAAARYLCTTQRHVRELWTKRYLAGIKVGRRVRFAREDLDAFIAARRVKALR